MSDLVGRSWGVILVARYTLKVKNIRTLAQLAFRIFVRPVFPFGQWLVFKLGIFNNPTERQEYLLGHLKEGITTEAARQHLLTQGFFMNRVAYFDPGQVLSMRRLDEKMPDRQYHLRIFDDGVARGARPHLDFLERSTVKKISAEVRGHYEYTPEDKPRKHLSAVLLEKREQEFAPWIKDIIQ